MAEETSSTKRIAKNTLMLYIRMFISMIVGLYTSRVVLNTLGVEDYGIYGVVGGVISMLGFLNASMSGATSRFITFELGKKDEQRLKDTFSSALIIHIGIALIVLIIAETVGLWFLNNKLVIPAERMDAAHWVYQCSILSAMLSITQVPYNACIIAHERMNIYAYIEILNVTLKLIIVYLLTIGNFDKLKLYAILTLAVSIIIMTIYRIYSIRNFKEAHFKWIWNKEISKGIISFSFFNLFTNFAHSFNLQSINFLINNFFGLLLNAATSIATTLSSVINMFVSNILTAFRPQITKQFSQNNYKRVEDLVCLTLKIAIPLYIMVAIPCILHIDTILAMWLNEVPKLTNIFCILIIITAYFETIRFTLTIIIHASGKVKSNSTINGLLYIINPIIIYILYTNKFESYVAYIGNIAINVCSILSICIIIKHIASNISISRIIKTILSLIALTILSFIILRLIELKMTDTAIINVISSVIITIIIVSSMSFFILLNKYERNKVKSLLFKSRYE